MRRNEFPARGMVLAGIFAFCLAGVSAAWSEDISAIWPIGATIALAEDAEFEFQENQLAITAYNGAGGEVTIPDQIGGLPVEALDSTFYMNETVSSFTLPDSVKALADSSVYYASALTSANLGEGLEIIGNYNFWNCELLTELTIPASVAYIGDNSITDCDSLLKITFKGDVPAIADGCFSYLPLDAVVYVPDDLLEAYQAALPSGLNIQPSGEAAVIISHSAPEEDFEFDAATGTITAYNGKAYYLEIPETIGGVPVKAIGDEAVPFATCPVYYVSIPEGVETIGNGAFQKLQNLVRVDFPSTLRSIGDSAFYFFRGYQVNWNEGLESIGAGAFASSSLAGQIHFPEGLKAIGDEAFKSAFRISAAYLPTTIESIGESAFADSGLSYLHLDGKDLPQIAATAFDGTEITDVDINTKASKEQMLTAQAFFDGIGQKTRVWRDQNPDVDYTWDHLSTYENGLMTGYTGEMTHIRPWDSFGDGDDRVETVGIADGALKGNQTVKYFAVCYNDAFTYVGAEAFADSVLETVDLFDSVTEIGDGAFRGCVNLTEITLPESLISVGEGILDGCENLSKVTVLCDAAVLPDAIFANCPLLLEHPEGIILSADTADTDIGRLSDAMGLPWYEPLLREGEENQFQLVEMPFEATDASYFEINPENGTIISYTGKEADVVVPREIDGITVRAIGYNAFEDCRDYTDTEVTTNQTSWTHLRSVVLPETVTEIADSAFSYCQQLETFICYGPAKSTGKGTFSLCRNLKDVIFVNGVGMIDNYAFEATDSFEHFYSPVSLHYIGESAFRRSGIRSFVVDATSIGNSAFWNCDNLSELHFTDKVKQVNAAVTNNCSALSLVCFETTDLSFVPGDGIIAGASGMVTIRVPEGIDEENLTKAGRVLMWGSEATADVVTGACDREIAEMPDIEAILDDYAQNPYIAPQAEETEPEPEPIAAAPVGEIGAPYVGAWTVKEMILGDTVYAAADFGMEGMLIILNEDGTALTGGGEDGYESGAWMADEDGAHIGEMVLTLSEDGNLVVDEDGMQLIFVPAEGVEIPAGAAVSAEGAEVPAGAVDSAEGAEETADAVDSAEEPVGTESDAVGDDAGAEADAAGDETAAGADGFGDAASSDTPDPSDPSNYVGTWHGVYITAGVDKGDPRQLWGLEITLTLDEDGHGELDYGGGDGGKLWGWDPEAEQMYYGEETDESLPMPLFLLEGGFLRYGTPYSGYIVFSQDPEASWSPEEDAGFGGLDGNLSGDEAGVEASGSASDLAGNASDDATENNSSVQLAQPSLGRDYYIGTKFVCTAAESGGYQIDIKMLGGEYSIKFRDDGSAAFVMAGTELPGLSWTENGDDFVIDYYGQAELRFVPSGESLLLDYMGSMQLTFEKE